MRRFLFLLLAAVLCVGLAAGPVVACPDRTPPPPNQFSLPPLDGGS